MAEFTTQGKIHEKATDNGKALDFVLVEETIIKDKTYYCYIPLNLYKNDNDYSLRLQKEILSLNIGDEVEIKAKTKCSGASASGRYFLNVEPIMIKVIAKAEVMGNVEQDEGEQHIPF